MSATAIKSKKSSKKPAKSTKGNKAVVKKVAKVIKAGKPNKNLKEGSTRMRMFKALAYADKGDGLTVAEIKEKTGMLPVSGHLFVLLTEEMKAKRILKGSVENEESGSTYSTYYLSAKGKKDFEAGEIDKRTAGKLVGTAWSKKRRQADK